MKHQKARITILSILLITAGAGLASAQDRIGIETGLDRAETRRRIDALDRTERKVQQQVPITTVQPAPSPQPGLLPRAATSEKRKAKTKVTTKVITRTIIQRAQPTD